MGHHVTPLSFFQKWADAERAAAKKRGRKKEAKKRSQARRQGRKRKLDKRDLGGRVVVGLEEGKRRK